jgi:hypothetical protein
MPQRGLMIQRRDGQPTKRQGTDIGRDSLRTAGQ